MLFSFPDPVKVHAPKNFRPLPASWIEKSPGEILEKISEAYPIQTAILEPGREITYRILNQKTNQVANALLSMHGLGDSPIPILLGQNSEAIIAIFGILKAGKIYLSLEPSNPLDYLRLIINDAQPKIIITDDTNLPLAHQLAGKALHILTLEEIASTSPATDSGYHSSPNSLAAIFYTSGTSGEPKGVILDQQAIMHRVWLHINLNCVCPDDRSPMPFPLSFAWSITPIFTTLLTGGVLLPCNYAEMQARTLGEWICMNRLTIFHISSSFLRQILVALSGENQYFENIRVVNIGGDEFYPQDVAAWKGLFPSNCVIAYGLASTEMGTICRKFFNADYQITGNKLPVGYPVPTIKIRIQTVKGKAVKTGEIGEIAVQSQSSFRGYWDRGTLKKTSMQPVEIGTSPVYHRTGDLGRLLPDGSLDFIGRQDNMIKMRGYRIDTGEISAVLAQHPTIRETFIAVKTFTQRESEKRLIAYIVPNKGQKPTEAELRQFLVERLPSYKVPARIVFMDSLPRSLHGKVDANRLPEPEDLDHTSCAQPQTDMEKQIARIWRDLLRVENIGTNESFFDLGGDSLLSIQMIVAVEKLLGRQIPSNYLNTPTIANLVKILNQEKAPVEPQISDKGKEGQGKKKRIPSEWVFKYRYTMQRFLKGEIPFIKMMEGVRRLVIAAPFYRHKVSFKKTILHLSYPEGCKKLIEIAEDPAVSFGLYRKQYTLFRQLIEELGDSTENPEASFKGSIIGNLILLFSNGAISPDSSLSFPERLHRSSYPFYHTLGKLIRDAPLSELGKFFSFSGLDYLRAAREVGQGVILLTYHSATTRFAIAVLSRILDVTRITTISEKTAREQSSFWHVNRAVGLRHSDQATIYAGAALQGQRLLENRQIIQLVSDVMASQKGYKVTLAGRHYELKPGFAELAINSGAVVIPHFSTTHIDAHIHTSFFPPLNVIEGSRQEKVASLISQYADFINSSWKIAPQSVKWRRINFHFSRPKS